MDVFDSGTQVAEDDLDLGAKPERKEVQRQSRTVLISFTFLFFKIRKEGGFKNDSHH
jgi:hypothetical protein